MGGASRFSRGGNERGSRAVAMIFRIDGEPVDFPADFGVVFVALRGERIDKTDDPGGSRSATKVVCCGITVGETPVIFCPRCAYTG
jgi:hypothetical protein